VFNVKWGVVLGGVAFVLALIFSLMFGKVLFLTAFFRALLFAVVFFVLGTGAWVLISSFLPELLFSDAREDPANIFSSQETPGSRVDITVGNMSGAALPDTGGGMSGIDEVGDIADLVSGKTKPAAEDMDQIQSSDYTDNGEESGFAATAADPEPEGFFPDFSAFTGGFSAGTEAPGPSPSPSNGSKADGNAGSFGDFGGFSGALGGTASGSNDIFDDGDIFSSAAAIGAYSSGGGFGSDADPDQPERKVSGNKPQEFEGDFSPKEIAAGLHTMLEKEKKG
jgi:hypothetical protein